VGLGHEALQRLGHLAVKKTSTRFTFTLMVPTDSSSWGAAGAWLTGGASGEGAS
jgi:hypothetical protein